MKNNGGFVRCGWDGDEKTEKAIKDETKATIRVIPFDENPKNIFVYTQVDQQNMKLSLQRLINQFDG